ncbi:hypothetical protein GCM10009716_48260 [Streptomyces sodiiphilus]|uniref:Uncharacterized protein n=1 Tax=Streptomyces sodiiphilus TaxID=226217 RepID=A0ABP5B7W4_9ACTN
MAETAHTVAVVADPADFARMRGYAGFASTGHRGYLRRMERHLRGLAAGGGETWLALFDPAEYAAYCARAGLDPDRPASRARYTGELAGRGATVRYDGHGLRPVLPALLAEAGKERLHELGSGLLDAAGQCPGCGRPHSTCAFERAAAVLAGMLRRCGPGRHHVVCSVRVAGHHLTAALPATIEGGQMVCREEPDALLMCTVLAAGLAAGAPGGLVLRSAPGPGGHAGEQVRGWRLETGRIEPLSEGEVFAAYCTDPVTGEPVPPEAGVRHLPGWALPPHHCGPG